MLDVYLKAIDYYIPDGRMTNTDLLEKFRADNEGNMTNEDMQFALYSIQRKFDFLGIETRACLHEDEKDNILTMAVKASRKAVDKAGMSIDDIDGIIYSGVTNPFREPSFAILLADSLDIKSGDFFDINDTCNGYLKSIEIASLYLKSKKCRNILVVTSENPFEISYGLGINYRVNCIDDIDNIFPGLLVGCGAAASILSLEGNGREFKHYSNRRESCNWDASILMIPGKYIPQDKYRKFEKGYFGDGRRISSLITRVQPEFVRDKLTEWKLGINEIDIFIQHQLGNNVTFATLDQLGVDYIKAPVNTFAEYGNMACANIPVNLAKAEEQGVLKPGDLVAVIGSSCGITYSLACLKW